MSGLAGLDTYSQVGLASAATSRTEPYPAAFSARRRLWNHAACVPLSDSFQPPR